MPSVGMSLGTCHPLKTMRPLLFTTALTTSILPLSAGTPYTTELDSELADSASFLNITSFIDVLTVRGTHTTSMDFNELTLGDMEFSQLSTLAILGVAGKDSDFTWIPSFNYSYSKLDVTTLNPTPNFDSSLHEITFPNFLLYNKEGSRWFHGLYTSLGLRSDLGNIDSRDFFLSGAIGSGYRFSDRFMFGLGVYGSDLTNHPFIVPAPVFVWMPTDEWLISYYGPKFIIRRELGDNARFGFEAGWNGGNWNVDSPVANQDSLRVELSSFRYGLFYKQRLYKELWGELAVGYTMANELKVNSPGGRDLFPTAYGEADGAPYISFGLSLNRW